MVKNIDDQAKSWKLFKKRYFDFFIKNLTIFDFKLAPGVANYFCTGVLVYLYNVKLF